MRRIPIIALLFAMTGILWPGQAGATTSVTISDCTITITLNIEIHGAGASDAMATTIQQDIEGCFPTDYKLSDWCPVVFDINVQNRPGANATAGFHQIEIVDDNSSDGDGHISSVDGPLPSPNGTDVGTGTWDNNEPSDTYAHEAGHLLGLGDEYTEGVDGAGNRTTTPNAGHENDKMATLSGSYQGAAIDSVITAAGVACPDECCEDDDEDGVRNGIDNCRDTANPDQTDTDGDGIGDACDPDDDNDGILDVDDNCPLVPNPDQADTDSDGDGNRCDPDDDNDTCLDHADRNPLIPSPDTDGDLMHDDCDPCPSDSTNIDTDGDHFCDDGDGSGIPGDNPCNTGALPIDACDDNCQAVPASQIDTDDDGDGDFCDLDDGLLYFTELDLLQQNWQDEFTAYVDYNLYRGDLEELKATGVYTQGFTVPDADRFCFVGPVPTFFDSFAPGPGEAVFYLVTGSDGINESSLGEDSSGSTRPNTNPCLLSSGEASTVCEIADGSTDAFVSSAGSHSPIIDADLSDWCFFSAPRFEDSSAVLNCGAGSEIVWWDAPGDAAVNDLATVATTQDFGNLYWAAELHIDPDPLSLPFAEIAIDVAPGGNNSWSDPLGALRTPGHCSDSTERLCTEDIDCHFCTLSTVHTGTPSERPRPCGSTGGLDLCDESDPLDVCIRTESCVNLEVGPPVPFVGQFSNPLIEPDYLLVFDFSRWLLGFCDAVTLLSNDGGTWVQVPRPVPDPLCPLPNWHFMPAVDPGASGGSGGPPGKMELAIPWEAFNCPGCAPLGPGGAFSWTVEVSRGAINFDYLPDLAIEDVMSEAVAGTTTTTTNSCP